MAKRWDTDEVHHGVAGGRQAIPEVDRLRAALALPDWIAEDPEVHLLPSLQAAAADLGRSVRATSVGPGLLSVTVSVPAWSARQIRAAALTMIGSIVEHATFVR